MGRAASAEMVPLVDTGEAAPFRYPGHVHEIVHLELFDQHFIANLHLRIRSAQPHLPQEPDGVGTGLFEMALHGLRDPARRREFNQPKLRRFVPIFAGAFPLDHDAGASLQNGRGDGIAVFLEDVRHPQLFAQYRVHQIPQDLRQAGAYFVCSLPNALISISTPDGRSSFVRASMVVAFGSRMSISLLCVRISNCSRDFLSLCGERRTQYLFLTVGSGIGPATCAPVLFAVETISLADWSRRSEEHTSELQSPCNLVCRLLLEKKKKKKEILKCYIL